MAKPKDENKIASIYQATLRLVLADGLSGLRMSDVAREAGIATGTLYIYFKDKPSLINALYLYLKRNMASLYIIKESGNKPFKANFDIIWKKYFDAVVSSPETLVFFEQYYRSPFFSKKSMDEAFETLQPIKDLLEIGIREKLIKNIDKEVLMAQLNGPIIELVKMSQAGRIQITNKVKQDAIKMAWDAVKA